MNNDLNKYLLHLLPKSDNWVHELESYAKKNRVPIMEPIGIHFVMQLIRLNQPKRILEIGSAIGYSALRMLEAKPDMEIVTIEKDEKRYREAIQNINAQKKNSHITVIHGDAIEEMTKMEDECDDCIFIDAAKGKYKQFFEGANNLLSDEGFIITDNVLFRGYVSDPNFSHPRYQKMVEKIRAFNEWLANHPNFITTVFPIGDGVAVSYKVVKGAMHDEE